MNSVADAEFLAKGQPKAKLVLLDNVNHMLKYATMDKETQLKAYTDPNVPIDKTVVSKITAFVRSLRKT